MIDGFNGNESLVIGIEGEWGSGKTSFVNLILEDLNLDNVLTIKFNPWNFSDQNELIRDFFNSMIKALNTLGENSETIQTIQKYSAKLLRETTWNAGFSFCGFHMGGTYKIGDDPLEEQKKAVNQLLRNSKKRIVVVVDDIDRLDEQETKLVFKLVKITANFDNTIFLLAYDRDNVSKQIGEKGIKGEEFLKKIVQVSFVLPRPDSQDLFAMFFNDINLIIKDFDEKYWDQRRWDDLFRLGLKRLFPTVRDIKRYVNGLSLDLGIIGREEINPIDFLGIESLRVFAPKVYLAMADQKQVFTATNSEWRVYNGIDYGYSDERVTKENRKKIYEDLIKDNSSEYLYDTIKEITRQLFPRIKEIDSDTNRDCESELREKLRVCSKDMFDKYFLLAIPSSIVSEDNIKDLLTKIDDAVLFVGKLTSFREEGKFQFVMERLFDCLNKFNFKQKKNLLVSIFDVAEDIYEENWIRIRLLDIQMQPIKFCYETLKQTEKPRKIEFVTTIINSTKKCFLPTLFVDRLNKQNNQEQAHEEIVLTKDEIDKLKTICVEKIKRDATEGALANSKTLSYILYCWEEWGLKEDVNKYIAKLLKTDEGLLSLLNGFVSANFDDSTTVKFIDKKSIGHFVDIVEIDERVEQIDENLLGSESADIIRLYKSSPEDELEG